MATGIPTADPGAKPAEWRSRSTAPSAPPPANVTQPNLTTLIAGARAAAVHELLHALLRPAHRLPHTPRRTVLVISRADPGGEAADRIGQPGEARRVDVALDDSLLAAVTLVAVRAAGAADRTGHRLADELMRSCDALVLVTDGRYPFQPAEVDLLRSAVARHRTIFLAVSRADRAATWPEVVRANQAILAQTLPELVLLPWHCVTRVRAGLPELRQDLLSWTRAAREGRPARRAREPDPPIKLAPHAAEPGWADRVGAEVDQARMAVLHGVERDLAEIRELMRRSADPGAGQDPPLGTAMSQFSAALEARVRAAVDAALCAVLAQILVDPPDDRVLARVRAALRADVAQRCAGVPRCRRLLRVTATGAAVVSTSRGPLRATPTGADPPRPDHVDLVLPPLGIELTANCVPALRALPLPARRDWVDRAIVAVTGQLARELEHQFGCLRAAIEDLVAESLDHDLLLV